VTLPEIKYLSRLEQKIATLHHLNLPEIIDCNTLERFALDLRQVLCEIVAQHSDFGRFLKACVLQVFQKVL